MKDYILLEEYMRRFTAGIPYEGYILCPDGFILYSTYESVCLAPSFLTINNPKPFAAPGEDANEIITAIKTRVVGQINCDNVASKLMEQGSDGNIVIKRSDGSSMELPSKTGVKISLDSDGYRTLLELRLINGEIKKYEYASIIDCVSNFGISPDLVQTGTEQVKRVWDWLVQNSTSNEVALLTGASGRGASYLADVLIRQGRYLPGKPGPLGMTMYTKDMIRTSGNIVINNRLGSFSAPAKAANVARATLKCGGNAISGLGLGVTVWQLYNDDSNSYVLAGEGGLDLAMGVIAFAPGCGWIISGAYFGTKLILTLCDVDTGWRVDKNFNWEFDHAKQ